jgi:hypothetical protein
MNQEFPPCPYCEKGVLVPTSDYLVPWVCTLCGSNLTRKGGLYDSAEPVWNTRDGRPLRFLADPKASAIMAPVVEKPAPAAASAPTPPRAKRVKAKGVKAKIKAKP